MKLGVAASIGLACSFSTLSARAASLGTITVTPSFETAGVIVQIASDSGNEQVTVEYKTARDPGFLPAHATTRFEPHAYATSLFGLTEGTDVDVRVTLADPDGVTGPTVQTLTFHTRSSPVLPAPSRLRWVGSGGRDVDGAGTAKATPYATPGYALAHALPGDEIRVLPGTYGQTSATALHGTEASPIVLRADDPNAAKPVIDGGGSGSALTLDDASYVVVDGFEIRNGGADADGHGVFLRASSHVTVRGSYIHNNGHEDVLVSKGAEFSGGAQNGGFHLIEDNDIADVVHETCTGASNTACPGQTYYGVKLDNNPGAGVVIRRNRIRGHDDNTSPCGDEDAGRDLADGQPVLALVGSGPWTNHDLELYDNSFEDARDDGMELDGICVNARIWRNTVHHAQNAFSAAPVMPGPYFFVRNVATGTFGDAGFKLNTDGNSAVPSRNVFVYHNTFQWETAGPLLHLWFAVEGDHNVPIHNVVFRNNVLSTPKGGACTDAYNHGTEQPSFDGDVWYTTDTTRAFSWWDGSKTDTYDTFAAFQAGAMQEPHGAFGAPGLGVDLVPLAGALVVDRAVPIPGINDRFVGAGADVGAYELGGEGPDAGAGGPANPNGDRDAGGDPGEGAAATASAGDGSGCGCRSTPRVSTFGAASFAAMMGFALARRRQRRRPDGGDANL